MASTLLSGNPSSVRQTRVSQVGFGAANVEKQVTSKINAAQELIRHSLFALGITFLV